MAWTQQDDLSFNTYFNQHFWLLQNLKHHHLYHISLLLICRFLSLIVFLCIHAQDNKYLSIYLSSITMSLVSINFHVHIWYFFVWISFLFFLFKISWRMTDIFFRIWVKFMYFMSILKCHRSWNFPVVWRSLNLKILFQKV